MSETSSHDSFYDSLSDVQEEGKSADLFPGLSAFLSQEEINKSLDLARRAIDNSEPEDFDSEKEISQIFSQSPVSLCETPSHDETKSSEQIPREGPQPNRPAPPVQPLAGGQAEGITSPASRRKPGVSPLLASPSYIRSLRKAEKRGIKIPNPSAKPKAVQQSKAGPQNQLCDKAASFIEELTSIFREAAKPRNRNPNGESSSPDSGYLSPKNQPSTLTCASASQSPTGDQQDQQEVEAEVKLPQDSLCYQAHETPAEALPHTHIPHPQPQEARHLSSAPRFIQKLRSQEVAEGSRVYLECRVTGNPTPLVRQHQENLEKKGTMINDFTVLVRKCYAVCIPGILSSVDKRFIQTYSFISLLNPSCEIFKFVFHVMNYSRTLHEVPAMYRLTKQRTVDMKSLPPKKHQNPFDLPASPLGPYNGSQSLFLDISTQTSFWNFLKQIELSHHYTSAFSGT
ncbi:hypothetical protein STEG23_024021, partial [Scotinomys teguina]